MQAPSGYLTLKRFADFDLKCSGSYTSQSLALGHCNLGSLFNYDGEKMYEMQFSEVFCNGTVTSYQELPLSICSYNVSVGTKNDFGGYYYQFEYDEETPIFSSPGVQVM